MVSDFPVCLQHVLASEGGYVNDPLDNGHATNEGVTQHVYDNWRLAKGLTTRSVLLIDPNEVEEIYRGLYWSPILGDQLPAGVDYATFDYAVNSGAHHAACALQNAVGVPADGKIGPVTLAAATAADPRRIINAVCSERQAFLESLPTFAHFGNGWSRRVASVEQVARGMVTC